MRYRDSSHYRRHLRHGWPIVLNLYLVNVVTQTLDMALHFGVTPLDRFLPEHPAHFLWHALFWTMATLVLVLYLTGHTSGPRHVVFGILMTFTIGLILNVVELAWPSPQQVHTPGSALLFDGLLIWINDVL